ncbi:MAG TPA: hypothetical protein VHW44_14575 [Pseudonocardiaceae bacterium]|jgi:hypothetical protein|nr:hypothetical protein [Pseudonocardiaceae bacterium]
MSTPLSSNAPGPVATRLFFTDFEGKPAEPEDVFADALDGGWADREPEAIALLNDNTAAPYDRFLACTALCAWGSPVGYQAAVDVAGDPDEVVWKDYSADARYGVDDTFALLAEDVGQSVDIAHERGTNGQRLAALAALLRLTPDYYFERRLVQSLYEDDVRVLAPEIDPAIEAGINKIKRGEQLSFDLGTQVAGLIRTLQRVDPQRAQLRANELIATGPGERALRELGDLVTTDTR